jgi:predicted nuclease with TOPRIM domain
MENETMLKEILNAFRLHSEQMDRKLDEKLDEKLSELREEMQTGFSEVNKRIDRLTVRQDGTQADLAETKETVHFLHSKVVQHEQKLHQLNPNQQ